jgi:hypothetical protein
MSAAVAARFASMTLGIALLFGMAAPAMATDIDGIDVTSADVTQLLTALHDALQPNESSVPIAISRKAPSEMPAYAQDWYYAGTTQSKPGAAVASVWLNSDLQGADLQAAIEPAFLLAIADGGYGGKAFKQLYDDFAAKDAALPANAENPFVNRQALAAKLVYIASTN